MLVNLTDGSAIALTFANVKKHNFRLFKESHTHVLLGTLLDADTGYLGLAHLHTNSSLPKERSRKYPLTIQERRENWVVSSQRIWVEHTIRLMKRFRIFSERYRNRRQRFALRFSLIAGICNFDRLV